MVRLHPQLRDAPLEFAWGGNVAITLDRMPHFGQVPTGPAAGAWFATGCNGSGVALNTWLGAQAAAVVADGAEPPAFAEIPFPRRAGPRACARPTCPSSASGSASRTAAPDRLARSNR